MALPWEGSLVEDLRTLVVAAGALEIELDKEVPLGPPKADPKIVRLVEAKGGVPSTMELNWDASKENSVDEVGSLEDFSWDLSLSAKVCSNASTKATSLSVLLYNQSHNILPILK